MKYFLMVFTVLSVIVISTGQGYAQIDNLTNMSAEWVRMSNRNAATDAADIVVFNPAGLMDLSEGMHLNVSNQILMRRPSHSFDDPLGTGNMSYEQDGTDWFVPNLYASYKKDKWSVFGGVYIPGGGAVADYPDGSYTTRVLGASLLGDPASPFYGAYTGIANERLKASSLYLATSLGGAYRVTDTISVALGIRNIRVSNSIDGGITMTGGIGGDATPDVPLKVKVDQEDSGWGAVFGVQVRPNDKLNLAFHYESEVKLDLETDISGSDNISETIGLFTDGEKNRRDFPAMVGLGASYMITPELRGEADFNYWFQKAANWGKTDDGQDISDYAGDCWSIGAAVAYAVDPKLEVSTGLLYTKIDFDDIDAYYNANIGAMEVLYSDNLNIGLGCAYTAKPGLKLNFSLSRTFWKDEAIDTPIGEVDTENSTWLIAVGFDYSI